MKENIPFETPSTASLRMRFLVWRNRVLGSQRFQRFAARNPLLRPVARRRAAALFDLVAGFTYTQTLLAVVETGLLERLKDGPAGLAALSAGSGLSREATMRLLRAAAAIDIVELAEGDWWVLGRHGAALQSNEGALAMIRHHRILYKDMADPVALLTASDRKGTQLAQFWQYAAAGDGTEASQAMAAEYSGLMAASQNAVAQEVLGAFPFSKAHSLLDIGGGTGAFLRIVSSAHPQMKLGLFDRPDVVALAREVYAGEAIAATPDFHSGDFFTDSLPQGYDLVSLVRILHDHDDEPAQRLLGNIHRTLEPGARLIIAEPMADTPGAKGMGDAYFGWYLWAMASGRPRSAEEIRSMLRRAGFASSRKLATRQPVIASLIVATA